MHERLPRRIPHVLFQSVGDGAVLLDTSTEVYYSLNEVGARICALLSKHETLNSLCAALAAEYPTVPMVTLRSDTLELLDELVLQGLLAGATPSASATADGHGMDGNGGAE